MNKIVLLTAFIFSLFSVQTYANIACPSKITCNWDTVACDASMTWTLDYSAASEPFKGNKAINLSKISAFKYTPYESYQLNCTYSYGDYSSFTIHAFVKQLKGDNWNIDADAQKAECSTVTAPEACNGGV